MKKAELEIELKRMTIRGDAHFANYQDMLWRVDRLATALERIRDHDKIILGDHMDMVRQIAREALE